MAKKLPERIFGWRYDVQLAPSGMRSQKKPSALKQALDDTDQEVPDRRVVKGDRS
ncbi:MAG: hypothetical protein U0103_11650 [Candidatus Obscuribacterales bacterium]